MKSPQLISSYQAIRPDEEARERMLQNILHSSEISPTGKDEHKMRKRMKPMVIAAIIATMILLMGCAIVGMNLHDWKIGEMTSGTGQILDKDGNVLVEKDLRLDIVSIHGLEDSPTYQAHQEWMSFLETYDPDLVILGASDDFEAPEAYYAYNPYSQDMVDMIDEITEKFGLKLLGTCAHFQRGEKKTFLQCVGIENLLVSEDAAVHKMSGYFYEMGNFKVEFDMEMKDKETSWPHVMSNTIYYSRKDCFDDTVVNVGNIEFWDQWMYRTSSGFDVLIASYEYGAIVFCDKADSVIYVQIQNHHETDYNYATQSFDTNIVMTKEQLEQVVEQIDFSIEVVSVDMALAREKLEQFQGR